MPANAPVPALDGIYKLELEPRISVEAPRLKRMALVRRAELHSLSLSLFFVPNDPYFDKQWAQHNIGQAYPLPGGGTDTATPARCVSVSAATPMHTYASSKPLLFKRTLPP